MGSKTKIIFLIISALTIISCNNNSPANASSGDGKSSGVSGSGDDYYYESTVTSTGKELNINETVKMYVSSKGNIRTESTVASAMNGKKAGGTTVLLGLADKPNESIIIDDAAKTYSVNHIDSSEKDNNEMKINSTVSKIGNETIMGFNCVHARIISKKTMGSFYNSTDTIDVWKSNDVPMEASVKDKMNKAETGSMYSAETTQQLKDIGCTGFTVKMDLHGSKNQTTIQLTKLERKDLPSSLFEIPAGYKEEAGY